MKKFLSLVLALAMILSCVSMVSFVVNAEEAATENPVGLLFTASSDMVGDQFIRKTNIYKSVTASDDIIVWDETPQTGDVLRKGYITETFFWRNVGTTAVDFVLAAQGG